MALTGLQIFKYLPGGKKEKEANCKKCGFPTCMAFAMKLAKNEADIAKCEFISDELKGLLEEASQVQQAEITFGPSNRQVKIGNETVMFRHDKKFVNPSSLVIKLSSSDPDFDSKFSIIASYSIERVGENLTIDAIALEDSDPNFTDKAVSISQSGMPLILISSDIVCIKNILSGIKESKPLVYLKGADINDIVGIEKEFGVPVVVSGENIESLVGNSIKAQGSGAKNIVLNLDSTSSQIENLTFIRRAAIENKFKPLGYPVISLISDDSEHDIIDKTVRASALICKYSNIIVLDYFDEAMVYALLTLRQNIFTDPQKPLQIEPKVYPVGEVNEESPIVVTTNFALTYFSVVSEIEASGVSAYLLITPSDGMSVLTAWAASKFTGEIIAKALKESNLESSVNHKKLIIPGYVSNLQEEIKEELPEWETVAGPNDAVDIPDFLRTYKASYNLV